MTKEEARQILIEQALAQSRSTIIFLVDCINGKAVHQYPEQTAHHIREIDALLGPPEMGCVHSKHYSECESCRRHSEWLRKRHEATEAFNERSV